VGVGWWRTVNGGVGLARGAEDDARHLRKLSEKILVSFLRLVEKKSTGTTLGEPTPSNPQNFVWLLYMSYEPPRSQSMGNCTGIGQFKKTI